MAERVTMAVRVRGRVQGVGFRAWTAAEARGHGLDGWVRNEADGSVRALVAGPQDRVARLLVALEQGPPAARVASVETEEAAEDAGSGFRVTR
ncbi:acylphosphatase [Tropicimonas sp. IMCC6043]|uniref:acylphosphatase n=1 Tax=Tropicimonas sp. IMCC6043 TaxID=2510645 RepID=UPI00101BF6C6|nr:acylphosphatase [Tropicimonas sp. IMCC6043]RYH09014.1 acylphosphatase [Tropicimonas sp. IMCC6043]